MSFCTNSVVIFSALFVTSYFGDVSLFSVKINFDNVTFAKQQRRRELHYNILKLTDDVYHERPKHHRPSPSSIGRRRLHRIFVVVLQLVISSLNWMVRHGIHRWCTVVTGHATHHVRVGSSADPDGYPEGYPAELRFRYDGCNRMVHGPHHQLN